MGAPESNAGDDFHFWWAASRALELIKPRTDLHRVSLEGLPSVDDPDDEYETVDVAEYYGGDSAASAHTLVLSQLKYSTKFPERAWTTAHICEKHSRTRKDGSQTPPRSVIADLAKAYRQLLDNHGAQVAGKARIALVTNQPGDPLLQASVATAADWIRAQSGQTKRATLLKSLPAGQKEVIGTLSDTIGALLSSGEFCDFLASLDLSTTGMLDRSTLARAVSADATQLTPDHGHDSARRLFHLVREQALPGASRDGIIAEDVFAALGVPELLDLYPAPPRLPDVPDPLPAPGARTIAEAALEHVGGLVVAHGPAGAGKTTALQQVQTHVPAGSVVVLFDCFGGGDYLSSGEERHTPQRFVTQVINELAQQCGTPLIARPPQVEADLWRKLSLTLQRASKVLEPGAVIVLAVDAADNAAVAAVERGDRGFLPGLVGLPLPERVSVVLTARSHRVPSLGADPAATVALAPFDEETSTAHLRRHRPDASNADGAQFHDRTNGNPRAQFYVLAKAGAGGLDMPALLEACAKTPEPMFKGLIASALEVSSAREGGQRWLALMLALARPVSVETLAAALDVDPSAVAAFAAGLAPGVKVTDGAIQFRDEDFETHVRGLIAPSDVIVAHDRLADMFLVSHATDPDAATHLADHLFSAGRLSELLQLVLSESSPVGISDGFRREQVQGRRLDLAARAAAETGGQAAAVRVAARGCDTASRLDTLSKLVESRLDLVAQYADVDLLRTCALRQTKDEWLGPVWMRLAAALSRHPERHASARTALDSADAWLRRWMAGRDETQGWRLEADDVAGAAEARYRLDGLDAAVTELRRWRPGDFVLDIVAALADRVADSLSLEEARDTLHTRRVPAAAQAPVLAKLASPGTTPDPAWVDEVVSALLVAPAGQLRSWQVGMLDVAVRHGDRQTVAELSRHWSRELPDYRWGFTSTQADGVLILRCQAAAAALAGTDLDVDSLVPTSLKPRNTSKGHTDDPRAHDRREWGETVVPIARAAVLAARAAAGGVTADEVGAFCDADLDGRLERAGHRWFTYDKSYRAWATLVASAAIDSGAPPALLDRLAEAAPRLLREGAPGLWLDLAETLAQRAEGHNARATDLCMRAAVQARSEVYSAPDRLDLIARAAEIAADLDLALGEHLFDQAVNAATGINDDAARLLTIHADLAGRASFPPPDRSRVAARLVRAAEAVAPHVTESTIVPYEAIAGAAARLDPMVGLAAASRWDDENRVGLASTLPAALTGAVESGITPAWQALALDHLIESNRRRLEYQLDIAVRMSGSGAAGVAEARLALARAADWLRRRVPAYEQPALARRLLDAAAAHGLDQNIRTQLEPLIALEIAPDATSAVSSRHWSGDSLPPEADALLTGPTSHGWASLSDDVAVLTSAHVFGEELREFITAVVRAAAPAQRVDALAAVAGLSDGNADTMFTVLADCLSMWRDWPNVAAWAKAELPVLVARHLPDLARQHDTDLLTERLRAFTDDDAVRRAVLLALPEARLRLTAHGWQNIAALLGRLCGPVEATDALLGLLADHIPDDLTDLNVPLPSSAGPIPLVLWSAFGHPRRAIRWRAAHAARDLFQAQPDSTAVAPLVAKLVRCLDGQDPGAFRDPGLHFYQLSAAAALLVTLHRVVVDRPALLAPHLAALVRHATNRDLPHAQIRELARQAALAISKPEDRQIDLLQHANQPTCCHVDRKAGHSRSDRQVSKDRRYDFDLMDTIPYWYAPLAHVFDVPVDTIGEAAEAWILDRWGLGHDDWMADARELRDQRSWERMSHRQGSIPAEENLRLYLEYHAMMAAAGELIDAGRPIHVDTWDAGDADRWQDWLAQHLPTPGPWLADFGGPVPLEPELFGHLAQLDTDWDTSSPEEHDRVLGLINGQLPATILVAASTSLSRPGAREDIYLRSALVTPEYAEDLQRSLGAASNPTDWKLPDEDEHEFEVAHGPFNLLGWLVEPGGYSGALDGHDPYAYELRPTLPMPGRRFRNMAHARPAPATLSLVAPDGTVVAHSVQWADPDPGNYRGRPVTSSGYRVRVDQTALLRHLADTGTSLIVEVQIGRHRTDTSSSGYRFPRSRIYLLDAEGRITSR
ncbi:hypothetical protein ACFXKW_32240 [Streptomyces sp. NPDC059193]|uniref:hypothetical protein n=1 Tax=Streptomyces sp. NPDC059193 TaxID=3346763 RepID=UPI0036C1DB66